MLWIFLDGLNAMKYSGLFFLFMLWLSPAQAQIDQLKTVESNQTFGDYTVHYTVFNSAFIPADVAGVYQLNRAKNRVLVNISVTRQTEAGHSLGLPATVTGTATNLMQQQRSLNFRTIDEGEATYYLADLRHTNEEVVNFVVQVQPDGQDQAFTLRFTRTLHVTE